MLFRILDGLDTYTTDNKGKFLIINFIRKFMTPDGAVIGAAGGYPGPGGQGGGIEIQAVPHGGGPLQAELGGQHRRVDGLVIDGPVGHRLELHAVFPVKDHLLHRVGELAAGHPVEHTLPTAICPAGVPLALGGDDAGEPVHHVRLVGLLTGEDGPAARGDLMVDWVPSHSTPAPSAWHRVRMGTMML